METWTREQWETVMHDSSKALFYLYTPICGTCMVASKMMEVIHAMRKSIPMGKADLNYIEDLAVDYQIESVPCLLIAEDGVIKEKIYAFQSVPHLLEKIG
ncbi:thioredoxin family protein [Sporosarcina pasteurii]|uniref:Thioredoxin n=1 Tax=Sporosarcina pasteurii TaxID=1474 RepID=A0A380CAU2_SPOPA|nr:thioredoxin family protein [Sporosarcina pasteurii]MDS9472750.1 thioredoxin family protein [Sporosarcina pasteurii]QBQ04402.1 thioredoxin [Sporosarcina pasteurii]SUJ15380.1 thioredoxin [Sporosarcina pasteurii]